MKTDYGAHDGRYRELRESGAVGWDIEQGYRAREALLTWALAHFMWHAT